jgi:hypothetical protein
MPSTQRRRSFQGRPCVRQHHAARAKEEEEGRGRRKSELIGGKAFSLTLDHAKPAASKDPKDHKLVGKPVPRDIPAKAIGKSFGIGSAILPSFLFKAACANVFCMNRPGHPADDA